MHSLSSDCNLSNYTGLFSVGWEDLTIRYMNLKLPRLHGTFVLEGVKEALDTHLWTIKDEQMDWPRQFGVLRLNESTKQLVALQREQRQYLPPHWFDHGMRGLHLAFHASVECKVQEFHDKYFEESYPIIASQNFPQVPLRTPPSFLGLARLSEVLLSFHRQIFDRIQCPLSRSILYNTVSF